MKKHTVELVLARRHSAKFVLAAGLACAIPLAALAQEVKLGVVLSSTGTFAFVGAPVINAIKMAYEELEASNYFGKTRVTLMVEDNRSDKQEALTLINRMATRDNAVMIIGPVSTGEAMAAAPLAVDLKVPLFTTATAPDVLKAGPWIFKSTETAEQYMPPLGKYVAEKLKPKSCMYIFIRDNEGYVRQKDILRDVMKGEGVAVAGEESILAADSDFTALATKIVAAKPACIYVGTPPEQGANIVLQARQAGMPAQTILVGNSGMGSERYLKAGGKLVEGTLLPTDFVPTGFNEQGRKFVENYKKKYGMAPDSWAAVGYSMMLVAANAIHGAGANPTRDAVRQAMAGTRNVPVVVGHGTFSLDADRIPHYGGVVLEIKDGKWIQP
jgi:branched-chain amino acid transport system substrate-binding protein